MCSLLSRYPRETISVGKQPLIAAALIPPHGDSLFRVSALIPCSGLLCNTIPSSCYWGVSTHVQASSHLAQALTPCAGPQPHLEISLALVGLWDSVAGHPHSLPVGMPSLLCSIFDTLIGAAILLSEHLPHANQVLTSRSPDHGSPTPAWISTLLKWL